ncbi:unnamed protein product [Owenia fusiformis]|uniref:Calponin-homology (CH) domain-containing protein n=1 Tax=Owenia fusiformis TaxID=6347 RepID=A0A8S4NMG2_OWEFU|nr:unnamed protein product [Owenia fusiformis]
METVKDSSMATEIDDSVLQDLYNWVDQIPLSRPKKNLARDFSDGVMCAEVVKHFFPRYVEIHNYAPASSLENKMTNWRLLNRKVFKKLSFELNDDVIRAIATCKAWTIERVLLMLRTKIDRAVYDQQRAKENVMHHMGSDKPEADQNTGNAKGGGGSPYLKQPAKRRTSDPKGPSMKTTVHNVGGASSADVVPRMVFEEKEQECLAKEETIQILQAKIRRLEHLIHLKDVRIDDLQQKMEHLRPTGGRR